jgi:hypothetical protein
MEYEIIQEIETCYSQNILSLYTIYLQSELEKNELHEYGYNYISGKINLSNNQLIFTISLPIPLSKFYEKELYARIKVLDKEYEKGFIEFLEQSDGYWYEPLESLNIESILSIVEPFKLLKDKKTIQFVVNCRQIDFLYPQKWLNLYFYEYRKYFPAIKERKQREYQKKIEILKQEYNILRNKISHHFDNENFIVIHNRLEELKIKIEIPFELYYTKPSYLYYTLNDNHTLHLLKKYGYKII